jgi:hypothetical protein
MNARVFRRPALIATLVFLSLPLLLSATAGAAQGVPGPSPPPVTGAITGPSFVGVNLHASYQVTAQGGPAMAANGTVTGIYSYKASVAGANATVAPVSGVLVNRSVSISLIAQNITGIAEIRVLVTSSANATSKTNQSVNLTYSVTVVIPYRLTAVLTSTSSEGINSFNLTVTLDGSVVGQIQVPSLLAKASAPVTFNYVTAGLSPGYHTFSLSVTQEHGLVVFANGAQQFSVTFYVPGSAPDYTLWYVAGAVALAGAIFIWLTRVAARRRGRGKK